jgi:hypothetical protein
MSRRAFYDRQFSSTIPASHNWKERVKRWSKEVRAWTIIIGGTSLIWGAMYLWYSRPGEEMVGMSTQIEQQVGAELRKAHITKWI